MSLTFAAAGLCAQNAAPPPPRQPEPSKPAGTEQAPAPIQVEVNEVIVPITVTDEKGRFVIETVERNEVVFDVTTGKIVETRDVKRK